MRYNVAFAWLGVLFALLFAGCDKSPTSTSSTGDASQNSGPAKVAPATPAPVAAPDAIKLTFTYGSEKKAWLNDVTAAFNASQTKIASGKPIFVEAIPMGSGESIDELLDGRRQAHLTSPASGVFIKLGNAQSRAKTGDDLIPATENLVLSPVVIAMWKPMAEALGYPAKQIGWNDVLKLATDPRGWGAYNHPEWGKFKFGHTHPEFSNSGLISTLATVYAGAGKTNKLTNEDVAKPEVGKFLASIESAVPHYGSSTGFFADKMFANGPGYLSAAVLYESNVVESYAKKDSLPFPVVAIYPAEGTFWSDHPVGIVNRDWVTAEHKEAAKIYIDYLLAREQQVKAMQYGFRPGDPSIALASPIDANFGVDPKEPKTTLEVPAADVVNNVIALWKTSKKKSNVVLVFDTSGSMRDDNKITYARDGAVQFIKMLGDEDSLSLLPFSSELRWAGQSVPLKTGRVAMTQTVSAFYPDGGTRLYDSIDEAYKYLVANPQPDKISAIVVLTDGIDQTSRSINLEQLVAKIKPDEENRPIRIFTIGYGDGKNINEKALKTIAETTSAKYYKGDPKNIRQVFIDIATFF